MSELARCPCGKVPESLHIQDGSTYRWRYVTGNCCGEWILEARVSPLEDGETEESRCEKWWNSAPRGES